MCGLCGFLNLDRMPVDPELLERMSAVIAHRGPDGSGIHVDGAVGLAHRRLAILDPARGVQPMCNEDRTVWISYNGEVYNSPEIRERLRARHTFRTTTDTEVLIHLWEEAGTDMVRQLAGMFAFAIWDARKRCLFLARDRVGIKPLYYAQYGQRFAFASELKSICEDASFPREMNPQALAQYFCVGYIPSPDTIFQSSKKLPPAHTLLLKEGEATPKIDRYWSVKFGEQEQKRPEEWLEEFETLLDKVVKEHLLSDVPLGAFLSGGVDSSLVVSSMKRAGVDSVKTFSIGFEEPDFNELEYADAVAEHVGTDHTKVIARPDLIEVISQLGHQYDEPFGDSSCMPTHLVSKLAREKVKVALSGDGGDEAIGGYRRYSHVLNRQHRQRFIPEFLRRGVFERIRRHYPKGAPGAATLEKLAVPAERKYIEYVQMMAREEAAALISPICRVDDLGLADYDARMQERHKPLLDRMQKLDIETYLPGDILVKTDRASMLVSLEVRVPLLDHRIIEFGARLPQELRADHRSGKILLKQLAHKRLPRKVIDRRKMGFAVPLVHWFRGPLWQFTQTHLLGPDSISREVLDADMIAAYLKEYKAGNTALSGRIWLLLMFEFWCRAWLT